MNTGRAMDVFDLLFRSGGQANQELAEAFGLAPSTVTQLSRDLLDRGLVESLDPEHYPSARKQENRRSKALIRPNNEYGTILAVDVTPAGVAATPVSFGLEPIADREQVGPSGSGDSGMLVEQIVSAARRLTAERLIGVGIAVSGTVDPVRNVLSTSIHLPALAESSFPAEITRALGVPTVLVNDAHAIAMGHRYRGLGRDRDDFIALYIADGVGAGIYADGRLYRGWDNRAGEIGSMIIEPNGDIGVSGRRGCFEDAVSRTALYRRMQDLALRGVQSAVFSDPHFADPAQTFRLLRRYFLEHDGLVRTMVDDVASRIGLVAANISAAFSPELIVLCGPLSQLGSEFLGLVRNAFSRFAAGVRADHLEEHLCLDTNEERLKTIGAAKATLDCHLAAL